MESAGVGAFLAYLVCVVFGGNFWQNGISFYTNHINVYDFRFVDFCMMLCRFALGIFGVLGVMGIIRLLWRFVPGVSILAPLGTLTLGVYFVQGRLIDVWFRIAGRSAVPLHEIAGAIIVYLLSFGFVWLTKRSLAVDRILWGVRVAT